MIRQYNPFKECKNVSNNITGTSRYLILKSTYKLESNPMGIDTLKVIFDGEKGTLSIVLGYKDDRVSVSMTKSAQRILDDYNGHAVGWLWKDV